MPYLSIILCVASAIFFYRAAEFEDGLGLIWSGLSLAISVATLFWLHWGWLGTLLAQGGFFVGITLFRMFRKSD